MDYVWKFHSYCGMSSCESERMTAGQMREMIRGRVRRARRRGQPVSRLARGEWEFQTPDDAMMVGDGDGILIVKGVFECRHCGDVGRMRLGEKPGEVQGICVNRRCPGKE